MTQPTLGFIGLGLMGTPMTERLLTAGYSVNIWNRTTSKTEALAVKGAQVQPSIADVVAASDIVMVCVTDTDAVEHVVFNGDNNIAMAGNENKVLIDFSSIDPERTQQMAVRLKEACGMRWIDSPVSGGVAGAEQGTLAIMCGGDSQDIEQVTPVLDVLSQRVTRMGDTGAGQVTKICNQMIVSCNVLVMAEVMALAEKSGVQSNMIPQALKGGFADSIPLQLTGPRMADRDYEPVKWHVKTLLKDLDMANTLAKASHSSVPMAGLGAELMRLHASQGNENKDPCTLIDMYSEKE